MNNTNKKLLIAAMCFFVGFVFIVSTRANNAIELDKICRNQDMFSYHGYTITKLYDSEKETATIIIKRGKRSLATHTVEFSPTLKRDWTCAAIYPLLGGKAKQLIIRQFTGSAHCCWQYHIYELTPRFRKVFGSEKWWIGDGFDPLEFRNLDKEKDLEFTQKLLTFHYFENGTYASSPEPKVVFKYDKKIGEYLPANRYFKKYLLSGIKKEIKLVSEFNRKFKDAKPPFWADDFESYVWNVHDIVLRYIYTGNEETGWAFLKNKVELDWIDTESKKQNIKELLEKDEVYKYIYRQRNQRQYKYRKLKVNRK